jgi:signal transduction histidine kinase
LRSSFAAHRAAASGLFALFCLVAVFSGSGDPRLFALLAGLSLLSLFLATRAFAAGLSAFLSPLAILADQALLWTAIAATAGGQTLFALLLPAGVALAWQLEGRAAARFLAVVATGALAALLAMRALPLSGPAAFPVLAIGLSAPALLAALEAATSRGGRAARANALPEALARLEPLDLPRFPEAEAAPAAAAAPFAQSKDAVLHDLKSPLSVMRVYADLIAEGARRGELPSAEHLANLRREIDLAERLVGADSPARPAAARPRGDAPAASAPAEPRAFAAPEAFLAEPSGETADLVEILGALATAYRLSQGGRRRIEFIAEKPELLVAADPVALQRAFRNVLENAVKYTPEGGEVRIRAGPAGPHAFVVFKDTGAGMSPEERSRAFDYAFRGAGAIASGVPGKGIGLAVTKQILEANGGRISISSEAGYGSEVTVLLPFARGAR